MNYDRIILELMDRVSALEDEVEALKNQLTKNANININENIETESNYQQSKDSMGRDTTKYLLDGRRYGKNRLVLAIVKKYMEEHPNVSADELMSVFDRSLQGSLGVVRELDEVKNSYSDYKRRFFCFEKETIITSTGVCVVCNQWGIANISNIIARARQLGIKVETL